MKHPRNDKGQIFSHIRQKWLAETPEERVRQSFVVTLHNEYGFALEQIQHIARGDSTGRITKRHLYAIVKLPNPDQARLLKKASTDDLTAAALDEARARAKIRARGHPGSPAISRCLSTGENDSWGQSRTGYLTDFHQTRGGVRMIVPVTGCWRKNTPKGYAPRTFAALDCHRFGIQKIHK